MNGCPGGAEYGRGFNRTTVHAGGCCERYATRELEPGSEEEREWRGLWMSQLMLGLFVGMREERPYEEWLAARGLRLG